MTYSKLIVLLFLLLLSCSDKSKVSGTEGTASETVGILYKSDFALANSATILIVADNATALPESPAFIDTIYTDSNGQFDLSYLNDGVYNIFGELNGNKSYLKSISINNSDEISDTIIDTLGIPGNVAGIVKHEYHTDSRYIIGLMPGTGRFFVPADSTGQFAIEELAAGTYDIRLISLLQGYKPKDTTFTVLPAVIDTILDTIMIKFENIALVSGLSATYDSLMQIVSLSWNKADSVEAYNIYRTLKGENQELITISPVIDTIYNDSNLAVNSEYTYTVAGVKTGVSGAQSAGIIVNTVSLYDSIKTIGGQGSDSIQFNMVGGMAVYKDSLLYVCDIANQRIKVMNDTLGIVYMIPTAGFPFDVTIYNDSALFIIDYMNATLHSYSLNGDDFGVIANLPSNNFMKLAVDNSGKIYAYNVDNSSIDVYKLDGTVDTSLFDTITISSTQDIEVDNYNNLHILNGSTNAYSIYDSSYNLVSVDTNMLDVPKSIFNNKQTDQLLIIENTSGKILISEAGVICQRINIGEVLVVSLGNLKESIIIGQENSLVLYKK